jgi:hypothetical protein
MESSGIFFIDVVQRIAVEGRSKKPGVDALKMSLVDRGKGCRWGLKDRPGR